MTSIFDDEKFEPCHIEETDITFRQQAAINKICKLLNVEFDGKTKKEASIFIAHYLPQYIEKKEELL